MRKSLVGIVLILTALSACQTTPSRMSSPTTPPENLPTGGAAPVFKAFPIYTDRAARHTHYVPSGYMGDSDLTMSGAYTATPHGQGPCLRVTYQPNGAKGWTGLYWQDPANNWGDIAGRAGYDLRGATKLTFWVRGENGGETIHEFRMGGIVGQYPDSDVAKTKPIKVTKEWQQFSIPLSDKDLRHIIAGFGFFMSKTENPSGAVFYLDDIFYEGPQGLASTPAVITSTASAPGNPSPPAPDVAPPAVPAPEPPIPGSTKELNIKSIDSGLRVSFSSQLMFQSGQAVLAPSSGKVLDQLIGLLSAYPSNDVLIEGHTDNTGDANYNLKLSELRATSVRDYLIKQGGFASTRFKVTGYGDTRPIADNTTKSGRSLNRRVEVTILKTAKS